MCRAATPGAPRRFEAQWVRRSRRPWSARRRGGRVRFPVMLVPVYLCLICVRYYCALCRTDITHNKKGRAPPSPSLKTTLQCPFPFLTPPPFPTHTSTHTHTHTEAKAALAARHGAALQFVAADGGEGLADYDAIDWTGGCRWGWDRVFVCLVVRVRGKVNRGPYLCLHIKKQSHQAPPSSWSGTRAVA